ncbi:LysM peptidoglycan-binding domain-containing M23 family metallopeptidase [Paraburkholderia sp. BL10I2N1]|uniref:LysM peptidoglycan-binding domain-containing M23 family metallopeptidase n=1 Tax=Paraburkholderia sp. BL10I2N1 TaxID=1938796 RepID=UPI001FB60DAD|nr:LysM peptidoglycan-binding domain-containing M23 family metallopeptidase [Paraburkholderia sp. BL10I2N1]
MTPWPESLDYRNAPPAYAATSGVPAGFYRVNPGDSMQSIAIAFGQRLEDVARWNRLPPNATVVVGQILRVAPPYPVPPYPVPPYPVAPAPAAVPVVPGPVGAVPPPAGGTPTPETTSVKLAWPVRGPLLSTFTPGKTKGIVIGGRGGDPVRAAAAGRVVYAGTGIEAYGPLIIIKHDDTLITAYGHNGALLVKEGDAVAQGQAIAEMGTDANGTGSLQFEVRSGGKPVDPLGVLPRSGG